MDLSNPDRRLGIESVSFLIVHAFAAWPPGQRDAVDATKIPDLINRTYALNGNYALIGCLQVHRAMEEYRELLKRR